MDRWASKETQSPSPHPSLLGSHQVIVRLQEKCREAVQGLSVKCDDVGTTRFDVKDVFCGELFATQDSLIIFIPSFQ